MKVKKKKNYFSIESIIRISGPIPNVLNVVWSWIFYFVLRAMFEITWLVVYKLVRRNEFNFCFLIEFFLLLLLQWCSNNKKSKIKF